MTDKPDNSTLIYKYLTKYTGGSIRHSKINCIDVNSALADLYDDMEKYYEEKILELEKDKQQRIYNWNQLNEQFGRLLKESESKDEKILEFIEKLEDRIDTAQENYANLDYVNKIHMIKILDELANEFGFTNHTDRSLGFESQSGGSESLLDTSADRGLSKSGSSATLQLASDHPTDTQNISEVNNLDECTFVAPKGQFQAVKEVNHVPRNTSMYQAKQEKENENL